MITFWVSVLATSILLYVLLDGMDLGVGILSGFVRSGEQRDLLLNTIAPVWDGNETWLVVTGVVLWGAFPVIYATLLSAFYLPLFLMLAGLILRGVAFEYRHRTDRLRWVWDLSFAGGSLIAAFMQGATVGAVVEGLKMTNGEYSGGEFGWLTPFSLLCGAGLCLGYSLLGACWLVKKADVYVLEIGFRHIRALAIGVLAFLAIVFAYAITKHLPILQRWSDLPYLFVFPGLGAVAALVLAVNVLSHNERWPFYMVELIFLSSFATLALSFWPYMIPYIVTIDEAAAPESTLWFMFWGGAIVFPLMLLYTVISYRVFKGKIKATTAYY